MEENNSTDFFSWDFNKGPEEYMDKWFLMGSPLPILTILVTYLLFVLKIGPAFMKNRDPYSLNKTILVYNVLQVIFSTYLCQFGLKLILQQGLVASECTIKNEKFRHVILSGYHMYFLAKVSELLDTVFFVLRKKWNQVSFLHVYHHFIMCFLSWTSLKYEPSDNLIFLGTLNSFVHVIMYAYYGLSAFPSLKKYLWWKKYITKMQLVQFVMILIHIQLSYFISECPLSYILLAVTNTHELLFIFLFGKFYINSYMKKRKEEEIIKNNLKTAQSKNDYKSSKLKVFEVRKNEVSERTR